MAVFSNSPIDDNIIRYMALRSLLSFVARLFPEFRHLQIFDILF
jgi:hypothetical protein